MTDAVTNIKVIGQIRAIVKDFSEDRAGQQVLLAGVPPLPPPTSRNRS